MKISRVIGELAQLINKQGDFELPIGSSFEIVLNGLLIKNSEEGVNKLTPEETQILIYVREFRDAKSKGKQPSKMDLLHKIQLVYPGISIIQADVICKEVNEKIEKGEV